MTIEVLGRRALSRATLERQMLLQRSHLSALAAVELLVGLQGQAPNAPYVGLWTRLTSFERDDLTTLLYDRQLVRSSVLRGTQHLVTSTDLCWLRPLVQPLMARARRAGFGKRTVGIDPEELAAAGRAALTGTTLTRPQLGRILAEQWPDHDGEALAWSVQLLVPIVHTPPNGTWGKGGATPFTLAEEWIGAPLTEDLSYDKLILRYLAGFGPASLKDVQAWSGLTRSDETARLKTALAELAPDLRTFRDEKGTTLYDLAGTQLPDPYSPAPVRFLPEFDNLLVGHADRTRIMSDEHRAKVITGSLVRPVILVDGFVAGIWSLKKTELCIEPFGPLSDKDRTALAEEGEQLLGFAHPGVESTIRFG